MLPQPGPQPNLSTRVDRWRQQIAEDTSKAIRPAVRENPQAHKQAQGQDLSTSPSKCKYQTRLQARISTQRAVLADTSSNPRLRLRKTSQNPTIHIPRFTLKRSRTMMGEEGVQRGGKRQRGRPRKDIISESSQQVANTHLPEELASSLPDLSIRPSEASPRRRISQSPRRKTEKSLDQTRTNANITLAFLETCKPSVQLLSYDDVRTSPSVRARMSAAVEDLHKRLQQIPNGLIPSELKVSWNSPFFSRTPTD